MPEPNDIPTGGEQSEEPDVDLDQAARDREFAEELALEADPYPQDVPDWQPFAYPELARQTRELVDRHAHQADVDGPLHEYVLDRGRDPW